MLQDLKLAFRQLVKSPGFTAVAVLTLAIAIGVNSAIFTLINGALLRPVAPVQPAEVVSIYGSWKDAKQDFRPFSHREYRAIRDSRELFVDVAAVQFVMVGLGRDEAMRRSLGFLTSENFFALMGARPVLGRFFSAEECRPDADQRVVVASHDLWKRHGGRADFLGTTVRVNGEPYTVVGVTPPGFSGVSALLAPDLWLPLGVYSRIRSAFDDPLKTRALDTPGNYTLGLVGRLPAGVTVEAAASRLPPIAARLTVLQPPDAPGVRELLVQPPRRFSVGHTPGKDGPVNAIAICLMAMAAVVLIVACLNLTNMMLARGTVRAREIAVRVALGATRWRIVRQLLCEGLLLAIAGGAVGLLISAWANDALVSSLHQQIASMSFVMVIPARPDAMVIAVTFAVCLLATTMFSLGPALKASRADLVDDLKQGPGDGGGGRTGQGATLQRFFAPRHLMVMGQIALSMVLLFSGGLFLRGAVSASRVALGFEPRGGVVTELDYSLGTSDRPASARSMSAVLERTRALPGVRAAALSTMLPYGHYTATRRFLPAGTTVTGAGENADDPSVMALYAGVTQGYFETIGVRLLRGRDFTALEVRDTSAPPVAILDQEMAEKLFPDGRVLGRRIQISQRSADGSRAEFEVVGIVNSHRHDVFQGNVRRRVFVPLPHEGDGNVLLHTLLDRADRDAVLAFMPTLRAALRQLDPDLPVLRMLPFVDVIGQNVGLWIIRLGAVLFGLFGAVALLLAAIGVYGVKSYSVARRTREIGIRVALGAHTGDVLALVLRQTAQQTALALAVGLLVALAVGRALAGILYEVSPSDPLALGVSGVVLAVAALLACVLPARRATRISPMTALRQE